VPRTCGADSSIRRRGSGRTLGAGCTSGGEEAGRRASCAGGNRRHSEEIPLKAYGSVPVEPLAGKTVVDTNNYYPERDGRIAALDAETTTTGELLQAHLPDSHVLTSSPP